MKQSADPLAFQYRLERKNGVNWSSRGMEQFIDPKKMERRKKIRLQAVISVLVAQRLAGSHWDAVLAERYGKASASSLQAARRQGYRDERSMAREELYA